MEIAVAHLSQKSVLLCDGQTFGASASWKSAINCTKAEISFSSQVALLVLEEALQQVSSLEALSLNTRDFLGVPARRLALFFGGLFGVLPVNWRPKGRLFCFDMPNRQNRRKTYKLASRLKIWSFAAILET